MPVRNEDWVLELSARFALMWVDELILLDHRSEDRSRKIMNQVSDDHPERVIIRDWREQKWDEMPMRQHLLEEARARSGSHIALIDADEILTANLLPNIRHHIANMPHGHILMLPGYNLRGGQRYHANGIWGNRWFSTAFADDSRLGWTGDRFHSREPHGMKLREYRPIQQGEGGVLHLWGASERRLRAKSALYKLTERLRWPEKPIAEIDRMYSWAIYGQPGHPSFGTPQNWSYAEVPAAWWGLRDLDLDMVPCPWQEAEVRRLLDQHGEELASGLDLFGVDRMVYSAS